MSSNYGLSFTQTQFPYFSWTGITTDSSGQLVAATSCCSGTIYVSSDYGSTYTTTTAPSNQWEALASSSSFSILGAASVQSSIFTSFEYNPTSQPSGQPSSRPSRQPSQAPTSQPSNQPSLVPTSNLKPTTAPSTAYITVPSLQPTSQLSNDLMSNPFSSQTWSTATAKIRIHQYYLIYSIYFFTLYCVLYLARKLKVFKNISDQLHQSANSSKIFEEFRTCEYFENGPLYLKECQTQRHNSFSDLVDANRIEDNDELIHIHYYIMEKYSYLGCQVTWTYSWFDSGSVEDFVLYLFNHHRYLKGFCSIDTLPLTIRSKRAVFILNVSFLFITATLINDVLLFKCGLDDSQVSPLLSWITYCLGNPYHNLLFFYKIY